MPEEGSCRTKRGEGTFLRNLEPKDLTIRDRKGNCRGFLCNS